MSWSRGQLISRLWFLNGIRCWAHSCDSNTATRSQLPFRDHSQHSTDRQPFLSVGSPQVFSKSLWQMCEEAGQGRRNRYDVKVRTCIFLSTKISGRRRSHFSCAVFLAMTPVCLRVRHCENFPACFFPSRAPRRTLVPLDTRLRRKFRLGCWSVGGHR